MKTTTQARTETRPFDVEAIRRDFPALHQNVNGRPLIYLDNAASAQKPQVVIDAVVKFYSRDNSNVHRGLHALSERATADYEAVRSKARRLLNAKEDREIIFTRGTTEAINLVAQTFGRSRVGSGDEVLITHMEHHSGIVPWQMLCEEKGARLRVVPISEDGDLILGEFEKLLTPRTRIVSMVHVSNTLGTVNPVHDVIAMAHRRGIPVLLDGAQAVPHYRVDVQDLDCDFYAFSGHKAYGPTGIGELYGKAEHLEAMPPYQGGGDMISSVTFEKTQYNRIPHKFEAGTPNVAGTIGLGAAIDYLLAVDRSAVEAHERDLLEHATRVIEAIPQARIIGRAKEKASVVSFVLDGVHPHDIGTILDSEGIAVRAGHHCTQPLMDRYGVPATARASLSFYNTRAEVDALADGVRKVLKVFAV
ncbi:MAG: cysteine desulfurase [Acidobacteria bacterium]|nr:cysteine desulfurase [Acidobacteriota bacterium]